MVLKLKGGCFQRRDYLTVMKKYKAFQYDGSDERVRGYLVGG